MTSEKKHRMRRKRSVFSKFRGKRSFLPQLSGFSIAIIIAIKSYVTVVVACQKCVGTRTSSLYSCEEDIEHLHTLFRWQEAGVLNEDMLLSVDWVFCRLGRHPRQLFVTDNPEHNGMNK